MEGGGCVKATGIVPANHAHVAMSTRPSRGQLELTSAILGLARASSAFLHNSWRKATRSVRSVTFIKLFTVIRLRRNLRRSQDDQPRCYRPGPQKHPILPRCLDPVTTTARSATSS
jgi:hypothetical protein